ncbi:histidine phosphatase family protein [Bacillus sp. APMAM]|nr:histidine phosphatase family protein [Bacillus sp. APMAM]
MNKIILVQHCQSEHHVNNMSGGWTDTPLTDLGKAQAEMIGQYLKEYIDKNDYTLYSSDLIRARQTAQIIGKYLELEVFQEKGLREINTGVAAGQTKEWAKANRNPKLRAEFDIDYQEFCDGETWRQFYTRVCHCMEKITDTEKGKNLLVVSHGGTIGYIVAWWMKFSVDMLEKAYFSSSVGGISILSKNNYQQNVINVFNDTSPVSVLSSNYKD